MKITSKLTALDKQIDLILERTMSPIIRPRHSPTATHMMPHATVDQSWGLGEDLSSSMAPLDVAYP